jgi:2-dehydro-3-deoxyphosphogluconate aldolase/(4S)-4-hydroxy-2-oxoglutarate aldolase
MTLTDFEKLVGPHRIMTILRGHEAAAAVRMAGHAWDAGVRVLEVTIATQDDVPALAATVAAGAERGLPVGAGTVISPEHVRAAARAGARYTVAPGFDAEVLAASLAAGMPHLPGVATGTEVQRAHRAGCRWVKAFPATSLGPAWYRAIRGPFPDVHYVATGGVTVETAREFLDAGARVVAAGAAFADPEQRAALAELVKSTS